MAEITTSTHTHNKTHSRKEARKAMDRRLSKNDSVASAIGSARMAYLRSGSASAEAIEAAEDWINHSVNAKIVEIEAALTRGDLKRSCSSRRLFIQLIQPT